MPAPGCPSVLLVIHDIFRSVPVWQKSNMSLTPVSQVNYRNFCPKQSNFSIPLPVDLRLHMDRQQMKTLEISSRRAGFFLNFDKKSRINRDRRPRVPASNQSILKMFYSQFKIYLDLTSQIALTFCPSVLNKVLRSAG